jgi:endoglycosylceramidase
MWADEATRLEALRFLEKKERYSKVVDSVYDLNAAFEKNELQSMYQKVADAIREVDKNHILFLNHSYFSNTGVSSAIEPTKLADGTTDPLVVYAAHGYDLVVDTKEAENPGYNRVEFIFERIYETGKRMNVPVLVGEWGAYNGKSEKMVETARQMVNIIEGFNFSNTYWAFYNGIGDEPYFQNAIVRPYPVFVSGNLLSYDFDFITGAFNCVWEENEMVKRPTEIFIPNLKNLKESDITITPGHKIEFEYFKDSNTGRLIISPSGKTGQCKINFAVMY